MNAFGLSFTIVASLLMLCLPRRLAFIPLLLGAAYMTRGQAFELGGASLTVLRVLVPVGFIRVLVRGEHLANGTNSVDRLLTLWAVVLIGTSAFHLSDAWLFRAGLVWSDLGCYFLFRIFLAQPQDVVRAFKTVCVLMAPLAVLMLFEKMSGHNVFGVLGGVIPNALVRDGHARASGPFAHPILAGTAGAICFGMAAGLWRHHRKHALLGLSAGAAIVAACASSGPILVVLFILLGMLLWPMRNHMRLVRWSGLSAVLALAAVMKDPVYFLMARIDISGGSQGYYRAQLIRSSIEHLDEWWLAGTDYTRHWMASGIYANDRHADITNHILAMGVMGGLPLMLVFLLLLVAAFRAVGRALHAGPATPPEHGFVIWTLGALLFGHILNFMSISLFDQSILFFYIVLAAIGAVQPEQALSPRRTGVLDRGPFALAMSGGEFDVATHAHAGDRFNRPITPWGKHGDRLHHRR